MDRNERWITAEGKLNFNSINQVLGKKLTKKHLELIELWFDYPEWTNAQYAQKLAPLTVAGVVKRNERIYEILSERFLGTNSKGHVIRLIMKITRG